MTEAEFKEQIQAAQDLCDSWADRVLRVNGELAQVNAVRRNEVRRLEALTARVAELQEALAKLAVPVAAAQAANGADANPPAPPA